MTLFLPMLVFAIFALFIPPLSAPAGAAPLPEGLEIRGLKVKEGSLPRQGLFLRDRIVDESEEPVRMRVYQVLPKIGGSRTALISYCDRGCSFRVLDLNSGKLSESFGYEDVKVIALKDQILFWESRNEDLVWAYRDTKIITVPNLTPEQHIRLGTRAFYTKDYALAHRHFTISQSSRFAEPLYYLGLMYEFGADVAANLATAFQYYEKAAYRHYPPAMVKLGTFYERGQGVDADQGEAMEWNRKAAEAGEPVAQIRIARAFSTGEGLEKSDEQALFWYHVAEDRLSDERLKDEAKIRIRELTAQLGAEKGRAVLNNASRWSPKTEDHLNDAARLENWLNERSFELIDGYRFLDTPAIRQRLQLMFGTEAVDTMRGFHVSGESSEDSGWLIMSSCRPHWCNTDNWAVAVHLKTLEFAACFATERDGVRFGFLGQPLVSGKLYDEEVGCEGAGSFIDRVRLRFDALKPDFPYADKPSPEWETVPIPSSGKNQFSVPNPNMSE